MTKLKRSNLSEEAYTYVRELFLNGTQYNPGDKVSIEELSRSLGVSRTPLWGAVNRLEAEGVVEVIPRQGVYLIKYEVERVLEIYEAREALEGMIARLAAERITSAGLASLKTRVRDQRKHLRQRDWDAYYAASLGFHEDLANICGNETLKDLHLSILARMRVMRFQRTSMPMRLPQFHDDHTRIIEALEQKNPDLAEVEARKHIRDLANQLRAEQAAPPAPQPNKPTLERRIGTRLPKARIA